MEIGYVDEYYNCPIYVKGGKPPYTFFIVDGELPPWASISAGPRLPGRKGSNTGIYLMFSGTPTQPGEWYFKLYARDSNLPQCELYEWWHITVTEEKPPRALPELKITELITGIFRKIIEYIMEFIAKLRFPFS